MDSKIFRRAIWCGALLVSVAAGVMTNKVMSPWGDVMMPFAFYFLILLWRDL